MEEDMRSSRGKVLEEVNPSNSWSSSVLGQDSGDVRSILPELEERTDPQDNNLANNSVPHAGMPQKSSISLEAVNLSSDFNRDSTIGEDLSMHPGSSNKSNGLMVIDERSLVADNPSSERITDVSNELVTHSEDMSALVACTKFNVTLKPSTLKTEEFIRVDGLCSSSEMCPHFDTHECHYTVPEDGLYEFCVRKIGHQNVQCCLTRDDNDGVGANKERTSKSCQVASKWKRGNTKIVVRWQCRAGEKVWVGCKGQEEDCGMTDFVFSGSLMMDEAGR